MRHDLVGFAFEQLEVSNEVISLKSQGEEAYLSLMGGAIRYRYDGVSPNSTTGHLLLDSQSIRLSSRRNIESFKCISASDQPSILSVTYERE